MKLICRDEMHLYKDKFFVHLYTKHGTKRALVVYICESNMTKDIFSWFDESVIKNMLITSKVIGPFQHFVKNVANNRNIDQCHSHWSLYGADTKEDIIENFCDLIFK